MPRPKRAPNPFPRPGRSFDSGAFTIIGDFIGVDECGRGSLAGPLCVCAVAIEPMVVSGVRDSKKISEKERARLAALIRGHATAWKIAEVPPNEIDRIGIQPAWHKAVKAVVDEIRKETNKEVVVDGNVLPKDVNWVQAIPKADSCVYQVAAASILAKAHHDLVMQSLAARFPEYGFEKHKGYGTKAHRQVLQKLGPSPVHRLTFWSVVSPEDPVNRDAVRGQVAVQSLDRCLDSGMLSGWEMDTLGEAREKIGAGKRLSSRQRFFVQAILRRHGV